MIDAEISVLHLCFTINRNDRERAISRILSAPHFCEGENHLSKRPNPKPDGDFFIGQNSHRHGAGNSIGFLFGLAPDGVFRAVLLSQDAVGSYPTFSPLPMSGCYTKHGRFVFCGTFRQKALSDFLPALIPNTSNADIRVTRHRALWSSDFPPPDTLTGPMRAQKYMVRRRFSAPPRSILKYTRTRTFSMWSGL